MTRCAILLGFAITALTPPAIAEKLPVRITWGHNAPSAAERFVKLSTGGSATINALTELRAANGKVNGQRFTLDFLPPSTGKLQKLDIIWADLIAAAGADTARRLGNDAAMFPHSPLLYVQTNAGATQGFAVTIDQLKRERALWVPSLDIYIAAGEPFIDFSAHTKSLEPWKGQRVLERIQSDPEATYEDYTARWEDMGSPAYNNPRQMGPGHTIGLAWDSSIHKFGIDRGAGVRNDFGNPDHFNFWFDFGDIDKGIVNTWKSQSLLDGLPIVTTIFERDRLRYELEQFAYPLNGPPAQRQGDMPMVLLQRLRVSSLDGRARRVPITLSHRRALPKGVTSFFAVDHTATRTTVTNGSFGQTLLELTGAAGEPAWSGVQDYDRSGMKRVNLTVPLDVPATGPRELVVKLPSPILDTTGAAALSKLDYDTARAETLRFWNSWLAKGAHFEVPEKVVNDLFRASLWHALRLPRRHGSGDNVRIDLPYSNFAYDQTGTPWPINQAVYVDYMLYGLRGYGAAAGEELKAQYRNNQELNGHVSGYANWLVYTPSMLYAEARNYFLSGDPKALDNTMGEGMKALDWCLRQVEAAARADGPAKGLVTGPLNDLTGEGVWAFNQAYMYAALDLYGKALEKIGNPRAAEARAAARKLAAAIERGFGAASAKSPLVQLADHTWIPYVPCETHTYHRILDDWYPTDVDTGPVHLLRLKALPATGLLAESLLNDHEDNLFAHGWGIANEPVYNQHATAYLIRDDPKAVIRTFYSYMASAFSHSALEPVEHRFTHGQYFGPPSTDGAWFELYRNMLIYERDDDSLLLGGFTPRRWLEHGKRIDVRQAPTAFGNITLSIASRTAGKQIQADVELSRRSTPSTLLVRLRHPAASPIQSVTVNGQPWSDFNPKEEWVRIPAPAGKRYAIVASY